MPLDDEATAASALIPMHCLKFTAPGPPVLAALPTGTPVWVVRRHADVRQVLTDPRLNRALLHAPDAPALTDSPNLLDDPDGILNLDGVEHQRLRRTVQRAFTPRAIERWRPWVASVVDGLLDDLTDAGRPADVVAGFSRPLPIAVISRLMGLDGMDFKRLGHWSDHALSTTAYPPQAVQVAMMEFGMFAAELIAERRKSPGEDLVSSLVQASDQGGEVTERQLVSLVCGLVVGGHETTMTSLGNALVYLLDEVPEDWRRIGTGEQAAAAAAEQLLRTIPLGNSDALPGLLRRAAQDVEIGGVLIPAGSVVAADARPANLDPEVYGDADSLDLFAPLPTPSLTFGAGPHHCLGAWLARMELELALHRLARRLPELRLAVKPEDIEWRTGLLTRSPLSLPVTW
ncbi:cytochrome P450 [Kitasatospora sp. MAP12-15]|uniref:cytochrome P450 n=1 Tax=unclassified Kitasatospora TaxID=2633591 RepID=UPI0024756097|nr:cytochrome P450 [Kitasatospora sp. MAP12-44]MDH6109490.1 cytochrome P450 [Kitasatospora sp. MAP12-44]